jgi:hypothetical protein
MCARATFDFPSATSASTPGTAPVITAEEVDDLTRTPASAATNQAEPGRRTTSRPTKRRVSADERKLGVRDLLAVGLLTGGATLEGDYMGRRHTAELLADGSVRYGGEVHRSLSSAGRAVKIVVSRPDTPESTLSTDGWDSWRARDPRTGQLRPRAWLAACS